MHPVATHSLVVATMVHRKVSKSAPGQSKSASGKKKQNRQWVLYKKLLPAERVQIMPGWWKDRCRWKINADGSIASGEDDHDDAAVAAEDDNPWGDMGDVEESLPTAASPTSRTASRYFVETADEETEHDTRTDGQRQNCKDRNAKALVSTS